MNPYSFKTKLKDFPYSLDIKKLLSSEEFVRENLDPVEILNLVYEQFEILKQEHYQLRFQGVKARIEAKLKSPRVEPVDLPNNKKKLLVYHLLFKLIDGFPWKLDDRMEDCSLGIQQEIHQLSEACFPTHIKMDAVSRDLQNIPDNNLFDKVKYLKDTLEQYRPYEEDNNDKTGFGKEVRLKIAHFEGLLKQEILFSKKGKASFPKSNSAQNSNGLKLEHIALKCFYSRQTVNKSNSTQIATSFGYHSEFSGTKLQQFYNKYCRLSERRGDPGTKRTLQNKIDRIEKVLPLLSQEFQVSAASDLEVLNLLLQENY